MTTSRVHSLRRGDRRGADPVEVDESHSRLPAEYAVRMYNQIVLPTDGSPGSQAAVDHAVHLARQNDATLHLIHVTDVSELDDLADGPNGVAEMDDEARAVLDPVLEVAEEAGVETVMRSVEGTPHEEVIEFVETNDIDLVVMGTHGKTGLSRVLLGSTAEKIVRHSPAPVLTARAEE